MAIIGDIAGIIFTASQALAVIIAIIIFFLLARDTDLLEGSFSGGCVLVFYGLLVFALVLPIFFFSVVDWKEAIPDLLDLRYLIITVIASIVSIVVFVVLLLRGIIQKGELKPIPLILFFVFVLLSSSWFGYTFNLMIFLASKSLLYVLLGCIYLLLYLVAPFVFIAVISQPKEEKPKRKKRIANPGKKKSNNPAGQSL